MKKATSLEMKRSELIRRKIIKEDAVENLSFQENQPHGFALNLTGHCNAKCSYCPQSIGQVPEEYIPMDVVDRLLLSTENVPTYFQFGTRGENLLNPQFDMIIRKIKLNNPDHYVTLNTNGLLMTGSLCESVVTCGLDQLIFSIQTCDPSMYTEMTRNPSYQSVLDNVLETIDVRNRKAPGLMIGVQFLDAPQNSGFYQAFSDFWSDYDVFTYKQEYHGWGDKFIDAATELEDRYPCQYLWLYPSISHHGNVCSCFADFYEEQVYGNLAEQSLEDIWQHSELRKAMIEAHLQGKWHSYKLCKECTGWREFRNVFTFEDGEFKVPKTGF